MSSQIFFVILSLESGSEVCFEVPVAAVLQTYS